MSEGWISKKIFFRDLQVGDIVSDNKFKHLALVTERLDGKLSVVHSFEKNEAKVAAMATSYDDETMVHMHRKQVTNG